MSDDLRRLLAELKDDVSEELEEAQWRWHHFENELIGLHGRLQEPAQRIVHATDELAGELKTGLERIRRAVRSS